MAGANNFPIDIFELIDEFTFPDNGNFFGLDKGGLLEIEFIFQYAFASVIVFGNNIGRRGGNIFFHFNFQRRPHESLLHLFLASFWSLGSFVCFVFPLINDGSIAHDGDPAFATFGIFGVLEFFDGCGWALAVDLLEVGEIELYFFVFGFGLFWGIGGFAFVLEVLYFDPHSCDL